MDRRPAPVETPRCLGSRASRGGVFRPGSHTDTENRQTIEPPQGPGAGRGHEAPRPRLQGVPRLAKRAEPARRGPHRARHLHYLRPQAQRRPWDRARTRRQLRLRQVRRRWTGPGACGIGRPTSRSGCRGGSRTAPTQQRKSPRFDVRYCLRPLRQHAYPRVAAIFIQQVPCRLLNVFHGLEMGCAHLGCGQVA